VNFSHIIRIQLRPKIISLFGEPRRLLLPTMYGGVSEFRQHLALVVHLTGSLPTLPARAYTFRPDPKFQMHRPTLG
jgi:hypothetical protein